MRRPRESHEVAFHAELLAEQLRISPEDVVAALLREKGSLIKSIETLRSGSGFKLAPPDLPDANPAPLSEGQLLDPEQPEPLAMLVYAIQDRLMRHRR